MRQVQQLTREGPNSEGEGSTDEGEPAAPAVPATGSATQSKQGNIV